MSAARGPKGLSTIGIHGDGRHGGIGDPVVPPIVQSATFFGGSDKDDPVLYTRYGNNPLQEAVGRKIARLEGAPAGLVLGSGMAAISMTLLALLEKGDHVLSSSHLYGATRHLFEHEFPRRGIAATLVDPDAPNAWRRALRRKTRAIYLEAPTNPTLRLFDPRPVAELAREAGIPVVMDATFATPVNLRARDLGVDVVVHSATKYLGGHSDLIAGAVAGDEDTIHRITLTSRSYGPAADPHMTWLLDRGLRTLDVRVRRHNENALALARFLEAHPRVSKVLYPGLASHPDHALATEILDGYGGMLSFVVKGRGPAADRFMAALQLACVAPSLGGVETLLSQPRYTSHKAMTAKARTAMGIPDGFVRVSVGIEDVDDLIADFDRALQASKG